MAAATITSQRQNNVVGARVEVVADSIEFAADADTWDTGLNSINVINLTPTTNPGGSFWFDISGGTLTLQSAGAITFRGGVQGNF